LTIKPLFMLCGVANRASFRNSSARTGYRLIPSCMADPWRPLTGQTGAWIGHRLVCPHLVLESSSVSTVLYRSLIRRSLSPFLFRRPLSLSVCLQHVSLHSRIY
jgi:hypothetical protein